MNNFFVNHPPFSRKEPTGATLHLANKALKKIGLRLTYHFDTSADMSSVEQRINLFHLLSNVFQDDIQGEIVELGTFTGQCALLFQKVNAIFGMPKALHVFDSFETKFKVKGDILELLRQNFELARLEQPIIHKGYFQDTLPDQLPETIAFTHIDCGWGGDPLVHKNIILHCLEHVYPRLSEGGICVFMDYYDPGEDKYATKEYALEKINPGVRLAVDEFFMDRPEVPITLYGRAASHAYIRKTGR